MLQILAVLLTVLFAGLKLTHQIDWSWWWVTAPLWIAFIIIFVLHLIAHVLAELKRQNRRR